MSSSVAVHDGPVIPGLGTGARGSAEGEVILTRLVTLESASMRNWNILLQRIGFRHLPASCQFIEVLAEELSDLRILEWLAGVRNVVLQKMIELLFVSKEL